MCVCFPNEENEFGGAGQREEGSGAGWGRQSGGKEAFVIVSTIKVKKNKSMQLNNNVVYL